MSKYVRGLAGSNTEYDIQWKIKDRTRPCTNSSKRCNLCITEAYHIMFADKATALNSRSELVSKCRHQKNFALSTALT